MREKQTQSSKPLSSQGWLSCASVPSRGRGPEDSADTISCMQSLGSGEGPSQPPSGAADGTLEGLKSTFFQTRLQLCACERFQPLPAAPCELRWTRMACGHPEPWAFPSARILTQSLWQGWKVCIFTCSRCFICSQGMLIVLISGPHVREHSSE